MRRFAGVRTRAQAAQAAQAGPAAQVGPAAQAGPAGQAVQAGPSRAYEKRIKQFYGESKYNDVWNVRTKKDNNVRLKLNKDGEYECLSNDTLASENKCISNIIPTLNVKDVFRIYEPKNLTNHIYTPMDDGTFILQNINQVPLTGYGPDDLAHFKFQRDLAGNGQLFFTYKEPSNRYRYEKYIAGGSYGQVLMFKNSNDEHVAIKFEVVNYNDPSDEEILIGKLNALNSNLNGSGKRNVSIINANVHHGGVEKITLDELKQLTSNLNRLNSFPSGTEFYVIYMEPMKGSLDNFVKILSSYIYDSITSITERTNRAKECLNYVAKIIYSLTDNLEVLRKNGYFYSDLKPANILYKIYKNRFKLFVADLGGIYDMKNSNRNPVFTYPPYFNNDIVYSTDSLNDTWRYMVCGINAGITAYLKSFVVTPPETKLWDDKRIKASLIWLISYTALLLTTELLKDYMYTLHPNSFSVSKQGNKRLDIKIEPQDIRIFIEKAVIPTLRQHVKDYPTIKYLIKLINIIIPSDKARLVDSNINNCRKEYQSEKMSVIKQCKDCIEIDEIIDKYNKDIKNIAPFYDFNK